MGRKKLRSSSPSSSTESTSKRFKKLSSPSVFDQNPFREVFGQNPYHSSIGVDGGCFGGHEDSRMAVDEESGSSGGNQVNPVLKDMLQFMELSKKKNPFQDDQESTIGQEQSQLVFVEKTVQSLLSHMREFHRTYMNDSKERTDRRETTSLNIFVSAEDIARLLLPWSVKGILQCSYKNNSSSPPSQLGSPFFKSLELLHWKTLDECLCFFLDCSKSQENRGRKPSKDRARNNSLNVLTLSTMHKLVPVALRYSLQESDVSEVDTNKNSLSEVALQERTKSCFCQLVDHLYRPPLDVVCDTLLPILTRDCAGRNDSCTTKIWLSVTTSTLRLMNLRLSNANPKKSFQLLVRRKNFLDLAIVHHYASNLKLQGADMTSQKDHLQRLQSLFKDLIRNGIFSLEHHMDGFRSLQLAFPAFDKTSQKQNGMDENAATPTSTSAKSSFRGYQEGLFLILEKHLIPCKDDDDGYKADAFRSKDAEIISCMLPLLLSIFFEQVSKMQKQQSTSKSHKKNKASEKLGHLQFQFFSCLSGYLLKGLTTSKDIGIQRPMQDRRLRLSFFAKLGENLDLLLQHNIYQPSLGNNMERSFLDKIGKEVIQSMMQGKEAKVKITYGEWKKALRILDVLIQLNHTILHDQLAKILARCLTFDSNKETDLDAFEMCEEASSFLITIISTYDKLRQLDYYYLNLFKALKDLSRQSDLHRVKQHLSFAKDGRILRHLGRAIQGSPIQQLQQIFSDVNNSIVRQSYSQENKFSGEATMVASAIVTKVLVGLLQNVRVDSNSFIDIYPICKDIMDGSVDSLLRSDEDNTKTNSKNEGNTNNAIMICAWTMHLKNRCEFWIAKKQVGSSSNKNFGVPSTLHPVLEDAISSVGVYTHEIVKNAPNRVESLKFLACQRIQQLHGECHQKQRLAYATDHEQYSTAKETLEAQRLVSFILQRSDSNERNEGSVSEMVGQLAILAESIAIWAPHANQNNVDSFLNQLLHAMVVVDESCRGNSNLLISLLSDSSFYEIPNLSQRLGINIASVVAENVQEILRRCDSSPDFACSNLSNGWTSLSIKEVTNISKISLTCDSKFVPEINKFLRDSLQVLDITNNVDVSIWKECDDASKIFHSLMAMETICNSLHISNERSFLDSKVMLLSALRITASRVLTRNVPSSSGGEMFEALKEDYMMLVPHTLECSFKIIDHDPFPKTIHQCMHSCTIIVESLVHTYLALGTKSTMCLIKVLESTFDQAEVIQGGFQYLILANYAVILLKKLGRFFGKANSEAMIELFHVIKNRIWSTSHEYCFNTPGDPQVLFQSQSTVLIAEALRLSSICSELQLIPLSSVENKIVARLRSLLASDSDGLEMRSTSYLVGCLAMAKPSRRTRQELTYELLLANFKQSDVFLTPLCILARGMETDEFDEFLSKLTSNIADITATVVKLRIVHMIVLSAMDQSQIVVLSNHSAIIMNNCLQVMTQVARKSDVNSNSIREVSSLIVDMASKKDMMVLREREIALILGRITATISVSEVTGAMEITGTQLKAYDASFSLVSLFLQRFSKQVQNCVPLLVIFLTTMLQFAMSKSLPTNSMSHCGQKFSRLCELLLPHADVYKKHVICLILRFVNSLREDVHPVGKKSLLPGIYCLLDIIQEHETLQLNSMLDEECRALLRSIHEGYKKIHVYKGQ